MKYKVHQLDVRHDNTQEKLEKFLNMLKGDIVSVIPDTQPTFQPMGATAKTKYLLIVEKVRP